jgi:hypothetical protein
MAALAFFLVLGWSQTLLNFNKPLWLAVWGIVCGLIAILLGLAFFDAMATQRYARRQLKSLAQERAKLMLEAIGRPEPTHAARRPPEEKSGAPEM